MPDIDWPRSLLGLPVAAAAFDVQALPVVGIFGNLLQYVPGALLYATALGIGCEVVVGRVAWGWITLPCAFAVLVLTPRLFERRGIAAERLSVPEEPAETLTITTSSSGFKRGLLEGYRPVLTARWPDGRTRARVGARLTRIGVPAFPLAGCPPSLWTEATVCRIRWLRPVAQDLGYRPASDPARHAVDVARLIGLRVRRPTGTRP